VVLIRAGACTTTATTYRNLLGLVDVHLLVQSLLVLLRLVGVAVHARVVRLGAELLAIAWRQNLLSGIIHFYFVSH